MRRKPDWEIEGRDWPNRAASRFVRAAGISWHVQIMGEGPVLLLLHGTGAATHSWRALAPLLQDGFTVVAPDLPGHGFTEMPSRWRLSLPMIAGAVTELLHTLKLEPAAIAGHSAGAAIALRMLIDRRIAPCAIVSLNGALAPFPGFAAVLFPALAKLAFLNPFAAPILARRASNPAAVARLMEGTGSMLDREGLDLYGRLLETDRHVKAALTMMANWDLRSLQSDLPRVKAPLTLVAAERDRAVPPHVARDTHALVAGSALVIVPKLGHLAHEEDPAAFAEIIRKACV